VRRIVGIVGAIMLGLGGEAVADRMVHGTVVDQDTGHPIRDALVVVGAADARTDVAGQFVIADVPFGRLDVAALAEGYGPYFGSVRVGATMTSPTV
jgi:Carboxypeptidase regulatory-like domain